MSGNRVKPRNGRKQTICLNMIVKNEAHIITETLDTIKDYIDSWVICDTGSTDRTKELIKEYFQKHNIPGEITEEPWANHFGYNRTVALKACKKTKYRADYIWVIDADDLIVGDLKLPDTMDADCYGLTYGKDFTYMRSQIFNNNLDWEYVGVRHEYPRCVTPNKTNNLKTVWIKGDYYIDSRRLGDRSKDPQKYLKDALSLVESIEKEPEHATRYKFYAGQSYLDYGDYDNAIKWYGERVKDGGWREEVYYSYYRIAVAKERRGDKWEDVERAYMDAWKSLPSRAEPLYEIAKHCRTVLGDFTKAYKFSKLASTIPYPEDQKLFLFKDVYDWKVKDELSINAYYIGKYQESFDICCDLLKRDVIPDWARGRIEQNRDFNNNHIKDKYIEYPKQEIETLTSGLNDIQRGKKEKIILTITTCKRFDLFEKTVNSFIRCCSDHHLITKWYCVDDNSSPEDRKKMKELYPFFEFVWKTPDQKGHPQSMNIIVDKVLKEKYDYVLHMEDDWHFFETRAYVKEGIEVLREDKKYGQVLFNRNYAETDQSRIIAGGIPKTTETGLRYLIHEHYAEGTKEYRRFNQIHANKPNCLYWPHYSLRPSLLRKEVFEKLGPYPLDSGHFEYDYSKKYRREGFVSVFFDTISCHHTGKLTYESEGTNAYKLNGIEQFSDINYDKIVKETKEEIGTSPQTPIANSNTVWIKVDKLDSVHGDLLYMPNLETPDELFDINPDAICFNSLGYVKTKPKPVDEWVDLSGRFPDFSMYIHKKRYIESLGQDDRERRENYKDQMIKCRDKGINILDWLIDHTYLFDREVTDKDIRNIINDSLEKRYDAILVSSADNTIDHQGLERDLLSLWNNNTIDVLFWDNFSQEKPYGVIFKSGYQKILDGDWDDLVLSRGRFISGNSITVRDIRILSLNLERREDRKEKMIQTFSQNGIKDYEFYPAVDGSKLVPKPPLIKLTEYNHYRHRRGIVGVSLSHTNMWRDLINDPDYGYYLILEDDVIFTDDFVTKFKILITKLRKLNQSKEKDWDIVMLGSSIKPDEMKENGGKYKNNSYDIEIAEINHDVCVGGAFGYLINRRGANRIMDWIDKNGLKNPIDTIILDCAKNNILSLYMALPNLIFTEWFNYYKSKVDTDIQRDFTTIFDCPRDHTPLPICVTITTCKRRYLFERMMQSLWDKCKDANRVAEWFCIDDGSSHKDISMMNWGWPFLNIFTKTNRNKGHELSMEYVPKLASGYKYVFHLEDDWLFTEDFYLEDLINVLEREGADQILCVERWGIQKQLDSYSGKKEYPVVKEYIYNHYHSLKPERKLKFDQILAPDGYFSDPSVELNKSDKEQGEDSENEGKEVGWWWPGFSLNPGVWKTELFKYFPIKSSVEDFEYELALRMARGGVKILCVNLCHHIGTDVSAYLLNNLPRDYE